MEKHYEIDFLIYKNGKTIPIEVKSNSSKETKSLDIFVNKYSHSIGERYVVRNKPLEYGDNLTYIPIYMLHNI